MTLEYTPECIIVSVTKDSFQIGEIARLAGVSVDTIRYYEKLRILKPAFRTQSGYRVFGRAAVDRIAFVKRAQALGFSLREVAQLIGAGRSECGHIRDLLEKKLCELDAQIQMITEFRNILMRHLNKCKEEIRRNGKKSKCPVLSEQE